MARNKTAADKAVLEAEGFRRLALAVIESAKEEWDVEFFRSGRAEAWQEIADRFEHHQVSFESSWPNGPRGGRFATADAND